MAIELNDLLDNSFVRLDKSEDPVQVSGFTSDSREVQKGWVFFAQAGLHRDGRKYIGHAIRNGAVAVVTDLPLDPSILRQYPGTVFLRVDDLPEAMAIMASRYYQTDCSRMRLIGITGTNGKTTIAHFFHQLLRMRGDVSVLMGTTGIEIADRRLPTDYTTPPAFSIHQYLREGLDAGAKWAVMEVSSHGLKLKRVYGLQYDCAVFTNLTHEHAELHPSMEDYYQTKARLFTLLKPDGKAVINADDAYGKRLIELFQGKTEILDYGYQARCGVIQKITADEKGQRIELRYQDQICSFHLGIPGEFNAYNAVAVFIALAGLGWDPAWLEHHLKALRPPAGRFQRFEGNRIQAIVDFAHTPDGLEKILTAVRPLVDPKGRLIVVFGCPGDRDPSKRPLMGAIASRYADRVIITSDDPHFEDPEAVIRDIAVSVQPDRCLTITDRREAIRKALELAKAGDWILIAGRGHERFQYVRDEKIHFYDPEVLVEEAARLGLEMKAL